MSHTPVQIPWRDRAFVSIPEAAQILARSPDWVRERILDGSLRASRFARGGPAVVAVSSILETIRAAEPVTTPVKAPARRLELVVSN